MPIVPIEIRAYPIARVPPEARRVLNEELTAKIRQRGTYPVILDSSDEMKGNSGMCSWRHADPDGALRLWPINTEPGADQRMLYVYLHELAHRLLRDVDNRICSHQWTFAAMLGVLLRRCGKVLSLHVYDVSDEAEENWGWAIQRGLDVSADLAPLPISAEECAEKIWRIWFNEKRQQEKP